MDDRKVLSRTRGERSCSLRHTAQLLKTHTHAHAGGFNAFQPHTRVCGGGSTVRGVRSPLAHPHRLCRRELVSFLAMSSSSTASASWCHGAPSAAMVAPSRLTRRRRWRSVALAAAPTRQQRRVRHAAATDAAASTAAGIVFDSSQDDACVLAIDVGKSLSSSKG